MCLRKPTKVKPPPMGGFGAVLKMVAFDEAQKKTVYGMKFEREVSRDVYPYPKQFEELSRLSTYIVGPEKHWTQGTFDKKNGGELLVYGTNQIKKFVPARKLNLWKQASKIS